MTQFSVSGACRRPAWCLALVCGLLGSLPFAARGQTASPPIPGATIDIFATERLRGESWDWFPATPHSSRYAMATSLLRFGLSGEFSRYDWLVEGAEPLLIGVPQDAVAPAPQGQLGFGGSVRLANGGQVTQLFLKQGFLRVRSSRGARPWSLRLGRFEFGDGRESPSTNPTLAALRRDRIADRLIGSFGFSPVGRSFDGVEIGGPVVGGSFAGTLLRPTRGVFRLDGMAELDVTLAYASITKPLHIHRLGDKPQPRGEVRAFAIHYADGRDVLKVDNRSAAARGADAAPVRVTSVGAHYLGSFVTGTGKIDVLLWGVWQFGRWGALQHRAHAFAAEVGYQPAVDHLAPWLRVGIASSSGDGNPVDGTHGTFFQVLPTPRPYARFPINNLMNLQEAFVSLQLSPSSRTTIRTDLHAMRLASATDLWYSGGGAFEAESFGYAGRPAGGKRDLARLLDASMDLRLSVHTTVTLYAGRILGGDVIGASYPGGRNATYAYLELLQRF